METSFERIGANRLAQSGHRKMAIDGDRKMAIDGDGWQWMAMEPSIV